ncbi:MAG: Spo0E family sporulation regulatory protein-aspartic acid phosphatase [Thermotaleaceae bacterium]
MIRSLDLLEEIDNLRKGMYMIIEESQFNLNDPNVQSISRIINDVIVSYLRLIYKN